MTERIDCHVHSLFSMDSNMGMDTICETAIARGLRGVCITDHVEHQPADIGYGKYDTSGYFQEIDRVRQKYGHRLKILAGIEFSEPHLYPKQFENYAKLPYDSIIGSVHYWIGAELVEDMVIHRPIEQAFEEYWKAVQKAVQLGGFTVLGHLDFPKRFFKDRVWDRKTIAEIFGLVLKHNIVPEINTSSLRNGSGGTMPDQELLDIYKICGGSRVCLGSDAHFSKHIGAGLDIAEQEAEGMHIGYFESSVFRECK